MNVYLAEARNRLDIPAPDGFAVTVTGCARLIKAIVAKDKDFPPELAEAVNDQVEALFERCGGPVPLTVRICSPAMNLEVLNNVESKDLLPACRSALARYLAATGEPEDTPVALAVHETVPAYLAGSATVMTTAESPGGFLCITAWPVDAPDMKESFFFAGPIPSIPLNPRSKQNHSRVPSRRRESSISHHKASSRSALLDPSFLRSIAECAAAFERIPGYPQDLDWVRGDAERPIIVNVSPAGEVDGMRRSAPP